MENQMLVENYARPIIMTFVYRSIVFSTCHLQWWKEDVIYPKYSVIIGKTCRSRR